MNCGICARTAARIGVLCQECRDVLIGPVAITGEQIAATVSKPSRAALIDAWGSVHPLGRDIGVGREPATDVLCIYEASVSRRHAWIAQDPDEGWTVRDLGSANGTFVDDIRADAALPMKSGGRIRFGFVTFYFVADTGLLTLPTEIPDSAQTAKPGPPLVLDQTSPLTAIDDDLQELKIKLLEPSGGGGGMVEVDGRTAQLSLAQFELLSRLIARMLEDDGPRDERGFIASDQLVGVLSLDSLQPNEDNVRQLVRRVRRRLEDAGIGDIIESKYRLGYRLKLKPRVL